MSNQADLIRAQLALGKIGGETLDRQIFLCALSEKQKCCSREEGLKSWNFLKRRLKELGLVGPKQQMALAGFNAQKRIVCRYAVLGRLPSSGPTMFGTIRATKMCSSRSSSST